MAKASQPAGESGSPPEQSSQGCGIIMPIAAMPGYDAAHWAEVLSLISRAIEQTGRNAEPVWSGGAADIIQERIVRNLYDLPIAICDVSGLNSNVMLELGMRLAFGKPTIIITDELVKPPFDINAIEYIPYPRDLHILRTETFIDRLAERIDAVAALVDGGSYRPFIKTFGPIEPGTPGTEAIPLQEAVLGQLEQMSSAIRRLESSIGSTKDPAPAGLLSSAFLRAPTGGGLTTVETLRVPNSRLDTALEAIKGIRNARVGRLNARGETTEVEVYLTTVSRVDQALGRTLLRSIEADPDPDGMEGV
jgi:hypothetical protein